MTLVTMCEVDGVITGLDKALTLAVEAAEGPAPMFRCLGCHNEVVPQDRGYRSRFVHKTWNPACGVSTRLAWELPPGRNTSRHCSEHGTRGYISNGQ